MNAHYITNLARAAKRDGLTLTWSLIRLAERLEASGSTATSDPVQSALTQAASEQQLDEEALALVLMAVIAAYPTGADLPPESIPSID